MACCVGSWVMGHTCVQKYTAHVEMVLTPLVSSLLAGGSHFTREHSPEYGPCRVIKYDNDMCDSV